MSDNRHGQRNFILASTGITFLFLVFNPFFLGKITSIYKRPQTKEISVSANSKFTCSSCQPIAHNIMISLKFPEAVDVGDTPEIDVNISMDGIEKINGMHMKLYDIKSSLINITSAGFAPTPAKGYTLAGDVILPKSLKWTFYAKVEGENHFILQIDPKLLERMSDITQQDIEINGKSVKEDDLSSIGFSTTAYALWPLNRDEYLIAKAVASLAAFILALPLLSDIYKRFWGKDQSPPPAGPAV